MIKNIKPTTATNAVRAARDVLEWLKQFGTLAGVDPELIQQANFAVLDTADVRALIAAAFQVPATPHAETFACYVIVPDTASKMRKARECGAVAWVDPAGDVNSNWRCAAGHDQDSPDV